MSRILFAVAGLVGFTAGAQAQPLTPLTTASGVGGFGGGVRPNTPTFTAPTPGMATPQFHFNGGITGGFKHHNPGFPFPRCWGSYRGLFYLGGYGYGYGYGSNPTVVVPVPYPVYIGPPEPPPQPPIMLSNEFPATLVLEFPAAAEVWVHGQKGVGEPTTEWTLTSPVLKAGGEYTFEVKARWKVGGKSFEADRSVTVAGGKRTRAIVVAGTEVKE
jgi:uncharacterized protein (TIGR03000 family)